MFLNIIVNLVLVTLLGPLNVDYGQPLVDYGKTETLRVSVFPAKLPEASDKPLGPVKILNTKDAPELTAESAVVVDADSGVILFKKNVEERVSMASLTKLMTAMVFLDSDPNWEESLTIKREDNREGAALFVDGYEKIRLKDLFYASLVGSANNATMALARSTGFKEEEFVRKMNQKVRSLGLYNTHFIEPTGLEPLNTSTALDIVRLAWQAFKITEIREAVSTPEYVFKTTNTSTSHRIKNTNELIRTSDNIFYTIIGGKTGYTEEAGFCLVIEAKNKDGQKIIAVVLGSEDNEARFEEIDKLVRWTFENYRWDNK